MDLVRKSVAVNQTLPKVLRLNRYKHGDLAKDMAYTAGQVSKWAKGDRELDFRNFEKMLELIPQHAMLVVEWMNKATHMIPPLANGSRFRKEPDTLSDQLIDEIHQAVAALNESTDEFRNAGKVKDLSDVVESVNQMLDVQLLIGTLEVVIETKYGLSIQEIEIERERYWQANDYTERG